MSTSALLERAQALGYELHSLRTWQQLRERGAPDDRKVLILRRDVDTDPGTAAAQFRIEQELGARASYFFRLSTLDVGLMRAVAAAGSDAGYHFEEIATAAKRRRLHTAAAVERELPRIRREFADNLAHVRERSRLPVQLVAAHGDMANRRLGINNRALLDERLRAELGIEGEAYDPQYRRGVTTRLSDDAHPRYWRPHHIDVSLERGDRVILTLTHPRHWRRSVPANLREDARRAWDGVRYARWPAKS